MGKRSLIFHSSMISFKCTIKSGRYS